MGVQAGGVINHQGKHNHHTAIFIGATNNQHAGHTDFTLGTDYEYRLPFANHQFGTGFFGEIVFADHKETIIGVPLIFHPTSALKFLAGAGLIFAEDHHGESESHFLTRLGTGYDFHLGNFSLSPTFNADFVDGHTSLVYGISIGTGF